ncbi:MAG: DUF1643 domain-containing protein [Labilithrix sp.]|nr:DUF1643 domain-containing protein [Labilithrix sp.]
MSDLVHTDRGTRSATISACGRYRYGLERATGITGPNLVWLMLNPSTADADVDDPTIRKVVGFTRRAGFGVAIVVNLFAMRATDPREVSRTLRHGPGYVGVRLITAEGPANRQAIEQAAGLSDAMVCAWGAQPWARTQAKRVLGWLPRGLRLLCLGTTKAGDPLHPLMPSYDGHPLVPFGGLP